MKKLLTLTFALFFTAGMAFGQDNRASTEQSGTNNSATIDQTGSSNAAAIEQMGENSEAIIVQVGNDNGAQEGRENRIRPGIEDEGDNNFTRARQFGDRNEVGVELEGTSARNDIRVDQGTSDDQSFDSEVGVTMKGQNNVVDIDQRGSSHDVDVVVSGDSRRNDIDVFQTGTGNRVPVDQDEDPTERGININGSDNVIDLVQDGSNNTANVRIAGPDGAEADFNTVDIMQTGEGHSADAMVSGMNNSSTITQSN